MREKTGEAEERFEITGDLDRQAAEALELELRRLAQRHGVEITDFSTGTGASEEGRPSA